MKITFSGAAQTVTGSMHIIQANGRKILLDCGLFQGRRKEAFKLNREIRVDPTTIDAVLLSHAHIDHSGNLPTLVKNGFKGTIYATSATCDLCGIMLPDSAYLQERDVEYVNKKRKRQGKTLFEPLYTIEDAKATMPFFQAVSYEQPFKIDSCFEVVYHEAGHILGSAMIEIRIKENGGIKKVIYTGDIGRPGQPILRDPWPMEPADVLISESTYGGREHEGQERIKEKLLPILKKVHESRSKMVIPSFSVGRTQHLIFLLHQFWEEGLLPSMPVYVDSPLSVNATEVFRKHPECYDEEILNCLANNNDPFGFSRLTYIQKLEESKALNERPGPMAIISASGMCEGGRVLHHLANTISNPDNTVLIIGYQAENTLGRRIIEKRETVRIYGDTYPLRARVEKINAFSAHADQPEILKWVSPAQGKIEQIFLVHGEAKQTVPLSEALKEQGYRHIAMPSPGDEWSPPS